MKMVNMDGCLLENSSICYLCSIIDEKTKSERGILADSPAATKKVLDVSRTLKNRVARIYVLSMGRGKQAGKASKHAATAKRLWNTCTVCLLFASFILDIYALKFFIDPSYFSNS